MSSQIFKNKVPNELLFNLLDFICVKNEKHYTFNINSFKKGIYSEKIQNFFLECNQYYHNSKKKYLIKKLTYNAFTTVLRQICNYNNIKYTSQLIYDRSCYNIIYYIYY